MSVTRARQAYIIPIFRDPADPKKYSLIARWHSSEVIAGDATGGTWNLNVNLSNAAAIYGQHGLWSINWFCYGPGAALASLYGYLVLGIFERSTGGTANTQHVQSHEDDDTYIRSHAQMCPDFKWRFSDDLTSPSQVSIVVGPNTNLYQMQISCGGYIWDERYIER